MAYHFYELDEITQVIANQLTKSSKNEFAENQISNKMRRRQVNVDDISSFIQQVTSFAVNAEASFNVTVVLGRFATAAQLISTVLSQTVLKDDSIGSDIIGTILCPVIGSISSGTEDITIEATAQGSLSLSGKNNALTLSEQCQFYGKIVIDYQLNNSKGCSEIQPLINNVKSLLQLPQQTTAVQQSNSKSLELQVKAVNLMGIQFAEAFDTTQQQQLWTTSSYDTVTSNTKQANGYLKPPIFTGIISSNKVKSKSEKETSQYAARTKSENLGFSSSLSSFLTKTNFQTNTANTSPTVSAVYVTISSLPTVLNIGPTTYSEFIPSLAAGSLPSGVAI